MRQSNVVNTQVSHGWTTAAPRVDRPVLALQQAEVSGGAAARWTPSHSFERGAALALLVLAAPLLIALLLFVLVIDGRPVLYRGERLGLRKRPFFMYKVRTLRREASQRTAGRLLEAADRLEIRGGRFLRDSRLDELPQLWNIVRGEMSFVGPRPERERVYRVLCQGIPGYARRFAVRPGMLGPSQLFTPHATPKRIRAWLDNAWSRRERSARELVRLSAYTALVAVRKAAARTLESIVDDLFRLRVLRHHRQRRQLRRVKPEGALAILVPHGRAYSPILAELVDLNEETMLVRSPRSLPVGASARITVAIEIAGRGSGPRIRHAGCTVVVRQRRRVRAGHGLVLEYQPASARSLYVLHQYFLRNALACPRAPVARGRRGASAELLRQRSLQPAARRHEERARVSAAVEAETARRSSRAVEPVVQSGMWATAFELAPEVRR